MQRATEESLSDLRHGLSAIGPELGQYDVLNPLADPTLELHDGTGALIASNDNWQTTIIGGIITQDQVQDCVEPMSHRAVAATHQAPEASDTKRNRTEAESIFR